MDTAKSKSVMEGGFNTRAIHLGRKVDAHGTLSTPINMTVSFEQGGDFQYAREGNPIRNDLENLMSSLEKAKYSFVLPSGNGAGSFVTHLMKPGEHILACQDMYGGLISYFDKLATPIMDYKVSYVNFANKDEFMNGFNEKTKLVWLESPTNPLLNVYDVREIAKVCKEKKVYLVFDNTFYTPYLMNPLELGADIVIHSGTKYIGGHSDIMMGFVCVNDEEIYKQLKDMYGLYGGCPSPFECYLALRGLKTLGVRMRRAQSNALKLAQKLESLPQVEKVFYPGLPSHEGYEINKKQARGTGAIVTFKVKGGTIDTGIKFCTSLHLFCYAGSLGGVEGLICTPTTFTHGAVSPEFKAKVGVTENLIRVSLGIEDYEDIEKDIMDAFKLISQ